MRKATSSFGVYHDKCVDKPCMLIPDAGLIPLVKNLFNLVSDREALDKLNSDSNMRDTLSALVNQYTVASPSNRYVNGKFAHTDSTMYSADL
jgi:hypothetical protein|nr:MAG: hypothetical protein [Bacteriophage sp.]